MEFKKDFLRFSDAMATLGAVYGKEKPAEVIDLYFNALESYDFATVKESIKRHVESDEMEGKFYPMPATLKIICKNMWAKKREKEKRDKQLATQRLVAEKPKINNIERFVNQVCISLILKKKLFKEDSILEKIGGWGLIKKKSYEISDINKTRDWLREQCKIMGIV